MDFGLSSVLEELTFGLASFATMSSAAMYSKYRSTARNLEVRTNLKFEIILTFQPYLHLTNIIPKKS